MFEWIGVTSFTAASLKQIMSASTKSSRRATGFLLVIASLAAASSHAFVTPPGLTLSKTPITKHASAADGEAISDVGFMVRQVEGGEDDSTVVDIAAYRNNLVNPQMMVDRAQKKRDSIDTTKAAIDGLKVGLLYVGPIIGVGSYFSATGDSALTDALTSYGKPIASLGCDSHQIATQAKLIFSHRFEQVCLADPLEEYWLSTTTWVEESTFPISPRQRIES